MARRPPFARRFASQHLLDQPPSAITSRAAGPIEARRGAGPCRRSVVVSLGQEMSVTTSAASLVASESKSPDAQDALREAFRRGRLSNADA